MKKNPHIFRALLYAMLMTAVWGLALLFLPEALKGLGLTGFMGIFVGIFYRRIMVRFASQEGEFYDYEAEKISSILEGGKRDSKRFRFFYPRAVFLLTVCFGGVGVGVITLIWMVTGHLA